jgi:hypothetical protein
MPGRLQDSNYLKKGYKVQGTRFKARSMQVRIVSRLPARHRPPEADSGEAGGESRSHGICKKSGARRKRARILRISNFEFYSMLYAPCYSPHYLLTIVTRPQR